MKSILKQSLKLFALSLAITVILTLSQSAAQAQLTFDGSTTGSTFSPGGNSNGGLSFRGTDFRGTTSSGGVLVLNNLGTLTINPSTVGESSGFFTFQVDFTLPNNVVPKPVTIVGQVFGFYTSADTFALIDFDNSPQVATFSGANGAGLFTLTLDDVCLSNGEPCPFFPRPGEGKLRRHKSLNALAFNTDQSGDGNVKFVKAKGSSSMFAPKQTFTITGTITLLPGFMPPPLIGPPTNKDECKNGRWETFNNPPFRNQGECVSFVNHHR